MNETAETIKWCAIGDSFTYLNDHLDETAYRVKKGYLTRTCGFFTNLSVINMGMNGSATPDWVHVRLPGADLYTVLLGTNDWHGGVPLGSREDFTKKREGTILGNLGVLVSHIRETAPEAALLVMNPVDGEILSIFWIRSITPMAAICRIRGSGFPILRRGSVRPAVRKGSLP